MQEQEIEKLVRRVLQLESIVKDLENRLDQSNDSLAFCESHIERLEAQLGIVHDATEF